MGRASERGRTSLLLRFLRRACRVLARTQSSRARCSWSAVSSSRELFDEQFARRERGKRCWLRSERVRRQCWKGGRRLVTLSVSLSSSGGEESEDGEVRLFLLALASASFPVPNPGQGTAARAEQMAAALQDPVPVPVYHLSSQYRSAHPSPPPLFQTDPSETPLSRAHRNWRYSQDELAQIRTTLNRHAVERVRKLWEEEQVRPPSSNPSSAAETFPQQPGADPIPHHRHRDINKNRYQRNLRPRLRRRTLRPHLPPRSST